MQRYPDKLKLSLSGDGRRVESLVYASRELLADDQRPLFGLSLRDRQGITLLLDADAAKSVIVRDNGDALEITYAGFCCDLTVRVTLRIGNKLIWGINVENHTDFAVEYVDFPSVRYAGGLLENGGDGSVLLPYNEGALITDGRLKGSMTDPVYPSRGSYMMFPNMVFAQFTLYMFGENGIYMGLHDASRAPKGIDFACQNGGTEFRTRLFMGGGYGEHVGTGYDIVWDGFEGDWHDGAELYRRWFEANRPRGLKQIAENGTLPSWYTDDMPLVVTYPVRGIHDMDEMNPNRLFPYENALPFINELASRTGSRAIALLMHWEGTAPWAPPYVWPPYGGEEMLRGFMEKLHAGGNLLGVYCSGFGYTEQSNLIAGYNKKKEFEERGLQAGMCLAPDQSLPHSKICTGQRYGYDICPASETGREILDEALSPLLASGIDYAQALDQNHGGGMYLCYAKDHGHSPVPGGWMTEATGSMLDEWRERAPGTLLGCESAAAEPFLASLPLSDNRYELNYAIGKPVPLYAYLYHPYLHNFMGNQVSCPLQYTTVGLNLRIAYSFLAGDLITFVINDVGDIMFAWGMRDFSRNPDRDSVIGFAAELHRWHKLYPEVFRGARMAKPAGYKCGEYIHPLWDGRGYIERAVLSSAWERDGGIVQFFANYTDDTQEVVLFTGDNIRVKLINSDGSFGEFTGDVRFALPARASIVAEY